jgi:hypothetical protein
MRKAKDSTDTTAGKTKSRMTYIVEHLGTGTYRNTDVVSARSVSTIFNGRAALHRLVMLFFCPSCHSQIKQDLHVMAS